MIVGSGMSYRKGLDLLNRLLHRSPDSSIKFRTYRDFCERSGKQIENYMDRQSHDILKAHGFEAESGKPVSVPAAELTQGAKPYTDEAVKSAIEKINTERHSPDLRLHGGLQCTQSAPLRKTRDAPRRAVSGVRFVRHGL